MTKINTDRVARLEKHSALLRATWHPEKVLQLAQAAREIASGENVLYHGTRYTSAIIATMELRYADNIENICLTRSPEVAAYWAVLERDDDEKRGGILILDRESLRCRYRIEPFQDNWSDRDAEPIDEMEETILGRDISDLARHLIGFVREPVPPKRKSKPRARSAVAGEETVQPPHWPSQL